MMTRLLGIIGLFLIGTTPLLAGSSNSLIDISPDGKWLVVANTDNDSITIFDLINKDKIREIPVGSHPEGVAWVGNGPMAIVSLYRDDAVVFVDTTAKTEPKKIPTASEPYGIVTTQDGKRAFVTHDYPGCVSEIDLDNQKVLRTIPSGAWSRGIAISPDNKKLYVSNFYTAELSALDLESGKIVDRWVGHSTDNLSRHVLVHPTRPKAYLSHIRSIIKVFNARGSIFPQLSICDLNPPKSAEDQRRKSVALDTYNGVYVVANPWEAAITPDGKKICTIYAGSEDMNVSAVIDDDYSEIERIDRAVRLGKNPRAVRVTPDGKEVVIYNTLDFQLAVFDTQTLRQKVTLKTCDPKHEADWVRGKFLFHSASPPMSGARWVACSSCHPDGQSDGRVWQNPEGPRKTPALAGLAHTHPLHWSADRDEVQDFEYTIRGKLMLGRGLAPTYRFKPRKDFLPASELEDQLANRSKDLDALAIYTNSFEPRLSPHIPAAGKLTEAAQRGKALFFDQTVHCASCHSGPYYTDSRLQKPYNLHDVGTGNDPVEKMGPKFDTPSLIGVYRTAPYLHHGKAATLLDVLTTFNAKDQHGKTSHLSKDQLEDLVAFLKALPYEMPADETPNTVPYREKKPMRKEP